MKVLHLDLSALGANSVSRSLTAQVVAELRRGDASAEAIASAKAQAVQLAGELS